MNVFLSILVVVAAVGLGLLVIVFLAAFLSPPFR